MKGCLMADANDVYFNTVDGGRFSVRVERLDEYHGKLTVKVVETDETLLDVGVSLSYGAIFGPDVSDVAEWQDRSIVVIDKWIEEHDATDV